MYDICRDSSSAHQTSARFIVCATKKITLGVTCKVPTIQSLQQSRESALGDVMIPRVEDVEGSPLHHLTHISV